MINFTYPNVWPLPYGTILRNDHSTDYNYAIERSQIQCWPVTLDCWDQVTLNAIHNGWIGHQAWVLRAWMSNEPGGSNILPALFGARRNIHLGYFGNSWTFHALNLPKEFITPANVEFWIYREKTYYFNIQNTSNISDGYYLMFTYKNNCDSLVI